MIKLVKVEKVFDESTFQPVRRLTIDVYLEPMIDHLSTMGHDDLNIKMGKAFIELLDQVAQQ